jgi:hypothetical protein
VAGTRQAAIAVTAGLVRAGYQAEVETVQVAVRFTTTRSRGPTTRRIFGPAKAMAVLLRVYQGGKDAPKPVAVTGAPCGPSARWNRDP